MATHSSTPALDREPRGLYYSPWGSKELDMTEHAREDN